MTENHLILTGLKRFWKRDAHLIFLTPGCCKYVDRERLKQLDYEVLPVVDETYEKFLFRKEYMTTITTKFLGALTVALNSYHGVQESMAYWSFVLYPWLYDYILNMYARYNEIVAALKYCPGASIEVLKWTKEKAIQWPLAEIQTDSSVDLYDYAHYVTYSKILTFIASDYNVNLIEDVGTYPWGYRIQKKEKRQRSKVSSIVDKITYSKSPVLLNGYKLRSPWLFRLRKLHKCTLVNIQDMKKDLEIDERINIVVRESLKINVVCYDEFERMIQSLLVWDLPTQFLENYKQIVGFSKQKFCYTPKVAVNVLGNNTDRVIFGEWKKNETKFAEHTHNILTSMVRSPGTELETCDVYYIWRKQATGKLRCEPTMKNEMTYGVKAPQIIDQILWCDSGIVRIVDPIAYVPMTYSQDKRRIENMSGFLKSLTDDMKSRLLFRKRDNIGWGTGEYYKDIFPFLRIDDQLEQKSGFLGADWKSFASRCRESKLVVGESICTAVVGESMIYNRPTIIIDAVYMEWEECYNEDVMPILKKLAEVGVLYEKGEEAADFINKNYYRIDEWWESEAVQIIVKEFTEHFFYADKNIDRWWAREVDYLAKRYK